MQSHSDQERRRAPRIKKSIPLKISGDEFDLVTETEDISCYGAYSQVNKYIAPMTRLKVVVLLPTKQRNKTVTKKVECTGVIVRTENIPDKPSCFNVAIFFSDITNKDRQRILDYVSQHLGKESVVT
ncbi:MAG: PilZ domain-containing protein [Candidatus Omnitrophota bacterium]